MHPLVADIIAVSGKCVICTYINYHIHITLITNKQHFASWTCYLPLNADPSACTSSHKGESETENVKSGKHNF